MNCSAKISDASLGTECPLSVLNLETVLKIGQVQAQKKLEIQVEGQGGKTAEHDRI